MNDSWRVVLWASFDDDSVRHAIRINGKEEKYTPRTAACGEYGYARDLHDLDKELCPTCQIRLKELRKA